MDNNSIEKALENILTHLQNNKVPVWHKTELTIAEANELTGIGEKRLREICVEKPEIAIRVGSGAKRTPKLLIKRRQLEKYLEDITELR
jgi:hypothetical protein